MHELCAHASGSGRAFDLPGATEHYAADRAVRAEHLRIEVDLDFERERISGVCTLHLIAVREVERVELDGVALDVESVEVDGRRAEFENTGEKIRIRLPKPLAPEAKTRVEVRYHAHPQRGLYFWAPDAGYPHRPRQAWTQGQDEDSRAWFPCLDSPSQRSTTEVIASFPAEMTALSNGMRVSNEVRGHRRTMHYQFNFPHPPYLVTLAVGELEEATAQAGETALRYLFPPGRKEDALRCVGRTPQILALFEEVTGQKYPYGSYAQVFVSEFIFGGMENTSATTLTDVALHDERAHADYSAESLISHELMHQWFGDLLTCRDWPHGWLNEGFATYGEVLWKARGDGEDEADEHRRSELEGYLAEAREHYARPIVARRFHQPVELFDRHLYDKGGLVLHELRTRLGDPAFFKAVRHYVEKNLGRSVETVDWARAIEESTGRNLDRFFDQYVLSPWHPELKVEVRHEAEHGRVRIKVRQAQLKDGQGVVYALTLRVCAVANGKEAEHALEVADAEHVFYIPVEGAPTQVRVDPRRERLATLDVDKPSNLWLEELSKAPEARARGDAAVALGKDGSRRALEALARALLQDRFWAVQAACARALGNVRTPAAKAALLEGLGVSHPKARRAVVAALGLFRKDEEAGKALKKLCEKGDPS
ncbi:MAG TPA: M1 family metallopeptidase, partial [Myxococcaceae bacterium]|nr:M1 family metallopeptidase [Myxococcaceae bacterium]